jgi:hypothetical protein
MRWLAVVASWVLGCATAPQPRPETERPPLPFIEDDYPRALAQARANKLPLFVEAWAPW